MEISHINEIPLKATPLGGRARQLVATPDLRLVNLLLRAGEKVDRHKAPVEVVFLVMSGEGRIYVDDRIIELQEGQILRCPAGAGRSLKAGEKGLSLLVVRAPNR